MMNIQELIAAIDGRLITKEADLTKEIKGAFAADLMSDVLASVEPEAVLLTGLCNPQVVRTAHMADVVAIVFVRGKNPDESTITLAEEEGIPLITSQLGMYALCGRLNCLNLPSLEEIVCGSTNDTN
ncbi:MAG: DRTGG domain-containing protein [Anaerolineaceae bacterium]|jgi:predicted transcriptional regulator|nr:DRTGG domain-containing protein [Anaerolineaceae bacterium]